MPSLHTIHTSITQHEAEHDNKAKLAEKMAQSAREHEGNGDDARARLDQNSADRYQSEADAAAATVVALRTEAEIRERKRDQLQSQLDQLDKNYQQERDSLQRELDKVA